MVDRQMVVVEAGNILLHAKKERKIVREGGMSGEYVQ